MNKITRLAAAFVLSGLLLAVPAAQAAPALLGASANFELEVNEMELEITADDPRPKAYLYTGGQSDYYFIVWMSSNPTVASVDGDGRVTGRSAGEATITAITDRGECAACKVTVRRRAAMRPAKACPRPHHPQPCYPVQQRPPQPETAAHQHERLLCLCLPVDEQQPRGGNGGSGGSCHGSEARHHHRHGAGHQRSGAALRRYRQQRCRQGDSE